MSDQLEIRVLPKSRWPARARPWVYGEDVVKSSVGDGGRGPLVAHTFPVGPSGILEATAEARRVELGEPECTGGCCGYLSVVVQRIGTIVQWSDWEVPSTGVRPPEFHFDADHYDSELAGAGADRTWEPCP